MSVIVASQASDAAQNVADSLNQGSITGWDVAAAIVVVVVSAPLARIVAAAVRQACRRSGFVSTDSASDIARASKWLVYLLAFALAASILGVDVGFLSVLLAFALVIGALALKPMVENSASGVLLLARPAFSVGDQIETSDFRGIVEEIGSRSTRLRQSDGVVVYVSNNQVLGNPIVVYSEQERRKGEFDIEVPADTDLDHLTSVVIGAIGSVDDIAEDPAPAVQATALNDNAVTLNVSYWYPSTSPTGSAATDRVIRATLAAVSDSGVTMAVPKSEITEERKQASEPADPSTGDADTTGDVAAG